MRYFLIRKKGGELHERLHSRKGVLNHVKEFIKRIEYFLKWHKGEKLTIHDYEVVEVEMKEIRTFEIDGIKDNIDKG